MNPTVVVCASFRFYQQVLGIQTMLSQAGKRCLVPIPNEYLDPDRPWVLKEGLMVREPAVFEAFWRNMRMHHERLLRASEQGSEGIAYVVCGDEGYVGKGVSSEIGFSYALARYFPGGRPFTIISSHPIADIAMRGYIEEVIPPDDLVRRLS